MEARDDKFVGWAVPTAVSSLSLVSIRELDRTARVRLMDCYLMRVVWAAFEDAQGNAAVICLDLRPGSPTQNRLFEKARHPNKSGAVLVGLGSEEEGIAIPLISRWLDSGEPEKNGYRDEWLEFVKSALLRLGDPIVETPPLPELF